MRYARSFGAGRGSRDYDKLDDTKGDSLVGVPSASLFHLDVPVVEDLFKLGQFPVILVRPSKAALSAVKALAEGLAGSS